MKDLFFNCISISYFPQIPKFFMSILNSLMY
jgi:hypothetical protein